MSPFTDDSPPAARYLRAAGEFLVLAVVALAAWPFGSVHPHEQVYVTAAVALLTVLWATSAVVTQQLTFRPDVVVIALGGIVLWAGFHLVPLSESTVGQLAPQRLDWHRAFMPATPEVLPGEPPPPASDRLTLSVRPESTRRYLADVLTVLILYAAVRNWVGVDRGAFRRLAWTAAGTGLALSLFALVVRFTAAGPFGYWADTVGGSLYGPFINRNHFPDFVGLCGGLAFGLLVATAPPAGRGRASSGGADLLADPRGLVLVVALGVMALGDLFSLSRGGLLSAVVAGVGCLVLRRAAGRKASAGGFVLLLAVTAALLFGAWLGLGALEARFSQLTDENVLTRDRWPVWVRLSGLIPGAWAVGNGVGAFEHFEAMNRPPEDANRIWEHAHNEYLEAVLDGGVPRLLLTLTLVVGVLVAVGRRYLRAPDAASQGAALGAWFGLAALVFHSTVEFGVRIPAVAFLAAVVAGYALAVPAPDRAAVPGGTGKRRAKVRVRVRKRISRRTADAPEVTAAVSDGASHASDPLDTPPPEPPPFDPPAPTPPEDEAVGSPPPEPWTARGPVAVGLAVLLTAVAVVLLADARSRDVAFRLEWSLVTLEDQNAPAASRLRYAAAWAAARPKDPDALIALARTELAVAADDTLAMAAAVAGPAGYAIPPTAFPGPVMAAHGAAGLRAARAARAACPIDAKPHYLLGLYAESFVDGDPIPSLERARQLQEADPFIWYRVGKYAFDHDDTESAWRNWRGALERGPEYAKRIVTDARTKLGPDELVDKLVPPGNAVVLLATVDELFPAAGRGNAANRRPFLDRAVAVGADPAVTGAGQLAAVAAAAEELGNDESTEATWQRALTANPTSTVVRQGYANWLLRQERYAEAVAEWETLVKQSPRLPVFRERLQVAKHGLRLAQRLGLAAPPAAGPK